MKNAAHPDTERAMHVIATNLSMALDDLTGHDRTRFLLAAFPEGRVDFVLTGRNEEEARRMVKLLDDWLPRFITGEKTKRFCEPDEQAVAESMRAICEALAEALGAMTGNTRYVLVVFPRDAGFYGANIEREDGKEVLADLVARVKAELFQQSN